ncbi:HNH endonuclease domain protein [Enterococcus hirae]|nr:HNH endonuclease domain protein [Enterococcus hirae]
MERDKTMTNTKGISLKNKQLRHAEYYDMTETFDELHAMSVAKSNFKNLMKFIIDDNNIFLAYRNIKKNKGSATARIRWCHYKRH